ncbi:ornithine carbamoyltransferase [Pseudonocardia humida]|uniref:Ornithine carbamoyltransferase n=1 Tax=Pseudonocardia humida TaxID=2800819 RepID=A0ABT1AAD9_9PSEU|nr:ornithine carbamoyltransferase [Pseudonocardia humida]MCO1659921.1 ornithine carbamoyltransferase [Pseudonocardia humida]
MTLSAPPRSLLTATDLGRDGFLELLDRAAELKAARKAGRERPALTGRSIALVFEKASTRTRCAFEVAAYDQGAHVTYLGPTGSHLGREESVADTARVLGAMFDGIEFRGFAQDTVEELARHAGVPVWNGLTDQWHPTQMLADVLTMREHQPGDVGAISFCFTGDGRGNIARSLLVTGAMLGMDVRIAAPRELWPPRPVVEDAERTALTSGARVTVTEDLAAALDGAAFVYTDVWVSMGEDDAEWDRRVPLLTPYRVTARAMAATGRADTRFLHCLPAVHDTTTALGRRVLQRYGLAGAEVTDEVFASPASVVFEQAENRLHTIKALLVAALGR